MTTRDNTVCGTIAGCLLFLALPAHAQQAPPPEQEQGSYILGGFQGEDDWQFVMGPTGSPKMTMRLTRGSEKDGAVSFVCSKATGDALMDIAIPGLSAPVGAKLDLELAVGEQGHFVAVTVKEEASGEHPPVAEAEGNAVPQILAAMANYPILKDNESIRARDTAGHSVAFALPVPRDDVQAAATICAGWMTAARQPAQPEPDPSMGGGINGK